jgi:hypothetical protein
LTIWQHRDMIVWVSTRPDPRIGYVRRLLLLVFAAVLGSMLGSLFTWSSANWVNANPLTAGPQFALLSLGPAMAVGAIARSSPAQGLTFAGACCVAMVVMWGLFAANESSTSVLVFLNGWFLGLPIAAIYVLVVGRRATRSKTS